MNNSDRLLFEVEPEGFGTRNVEPFETWYDRVKHLFPNFPEEVMQEWVYRHWKAVMYNWGWLDFKAMTFEKVSLSVTDINKIETPHQDVITRLSSRWSNPLVQKSWLVEYMLTNKTWNSPPIVLQHTTVIEATNKRTFNPDMNLLEGHHRLAYLRAMVDNGSEVNNNHHIWLIKIEGV